MKSSKTHFLNPPQVSKHLPVHTYGRCGSLPCPGSSLRDCLVSLDRRGYDFILVLERHLCQHYQSRALWEALKHAKNMVPVVFGGVDYSGRQVLAL